MYYNIYHPHSFTFSSISMHSLRFFFVFLFFVVVCFVLFSSIRHRASSNPHALFSAVHQTQFGFDVGGRHHDAPHLQRAISRGHGDIVKLLVHSGADVTAQNEVTGKTSLHVAAASNNASSCDDILDFLVACSQIYELRSDNIRSNKGNNCDIPRGPMHLREKVDFLGRNLNMPDTHSPVDHRLRSRRNTNNAEDMVNNNNNNNNNIENYCFNKAFAISGSHDGKHRRGHSERFSNRDFLETRDKIQGNTALHVACSYNNDKAALCLLRHGANPNPLNFHGDTPLARLLQPVSRRTDDSHNRSRLVLARRLVALGLVVEKKQSSDCATSMRKGINFGTGSGRVTSGCGSARAKHGPGSGKIVSSHDGDKKDTEEQNVNIDSDNNNSMEVERIFAEAKAENAGVGQRYKDDYSKELGVTSGKERPTAYAISGARDHCTAALGGDSTACRRTPESMSQLRTSKPQPPSREDLEAQLEALCVFQAAESPQTDPERTSSSSENFRSEKFPIPDPSRSSRVSRHRDSSRPHFSRLPESGYPSLESESQKVEGKETRLCDAAARRQSEGDSNHSSTERRRPALSDSSLQDLTKSKQFYKRRETPSAKHSSNKFSKSNREWFHQTQAYVKNQNSPLSAMPDEKAKTKNASMRSQNKQNLAVDLDEQGNYLMTSSKSGHKKSPSSASPLSLHSLEDDVSRLQLRDARRRPRSRQESLSFAERSQSLPQNTETRSLNNSSRFATSAASSVVCLTESEVPLMPLSKVSQQKDQDTAGGNSSTAEVQTERFRFPSRDERIRLRFKRLLGELSATLTLQQLCRLAILRSLTGKSVAGSVDKLGLPVLMQKFLLRDDLF